jgi:hypothetical protein
MNPRDLQFGRTVAVLFAGMAALCLFATGLFVAHRISSSGPIATAEVVDNFAGRTDDGILLIVERKDTGERIRVQTLHDRSGDFPTGSTVEIRTPSAGIPYVNDPGTELVPILVTTTGFVIAAAISLLFKRLHASRADGG